MFKPAGIKKYIHEVPERKELESLKIDDLISLAKYRRSIKHPFKEALVEYLLKLENLCESG